MCDGRLHGSSRCCHWVDGSPARGMRLCPPHLAACQSLPCAAGAVHRAAGHAVEERLLPLLPQGRWRRKPRRAVHEDGGRRYHARADQRGQERLLHHPRPQVPQRPRHRRSRRALRHQGWPVAQGRRRHRGPQNRCGEVAAVPALSVAGRGGADGGGRPLCPRLPGPHQGPPRRPRGHEGDAGGDRRAVQRGCSAAARGDAQEDARGRGLPHEQKDRAARRQGPEDAPQRRRRPHPRLPAVLRGSVLSCALLPGRLPHAPLPPRLPGPQETEGRCP
mmetsp:Transcript_29486/g.70959  ORF Transcript_29486/g.70959 Transcript_29486/m.70959 type:complete len:276 (+) Transcript_29486:322-1149(+)